MQNKILRVYAPAKINWSLDIVGQRADGYHLLQTLMQSVDLYDVVYLSKAKQDSVFMHGLGIELSAADNIAYKAWLLLKQRFNIPSGLEINIHKNIPAAGGLAGGSTDAAAVLIGVNKLFALGLSVDDLCRIGLELGADIPFCLHGGLAYVSGIGDQVQPVDAPYVYDLVLVNPGVEISTGKIYKDFCHYTSLPHPQTYAVLQALQHERSYLLPKLCANHLEAPVFAAFPEVAQLKQRCIDMGMTSLMSGSGGTVWALANDRCTALRAAAQLRREYPFAKAVRSMNHGIVVDMEDR